MKDELIISGNDIELVSKSAALINYQARAPHHHLTSMTAKLHASRHKFSASCT